MTIDPIIHDELRVLIAALAGGGRAEDVLDDAQRTALAAHLAGCSTCRRELALQEHVRARLARAAGAEPAPAAMVAMVRGLARSDVRPARRSRALIAVAASGWIVAACIALAWCGRPTLEVSQPPMVEAALRDFDRALESELPAPGTLVELAAGVGHPVAALAHADLRLISTWRTEIRGEQAAALAYRLGDRVIVQYVVSESLFFRQPVVRDAIQAHGVFATSHGARSVVAFAGQGAGSVVIGVLPPDELARLTPR
jgi:hypothetical protein